MPVTSLMAVTLRASVREAALLDDEVDARRDLLADRALRKIEAGHEDERLEARDGLDGRVRVRRRERAVVAGVHRLEHVERLAAAALADDDAVGAHAERVLHEIADRVLAAALEVRGARLERDDVRLLELELGGVLDRDDALVSGDDAREAR